MNNIIYPNDSSVDRKKKLTIFDIRNMFVLKQHSLWWEEDEKRFVKKYGISSDDQRLNKIRERGIEWQ
tara:strand:+ start:20 stop:223 length:204 start_codon:yes stop_codon:yes gene_type:complete